MSLDLNTVWYILVGVLFTGYAMLDGFDLGVGALHLFTRGDEERRVMLNAIGPVWDGNEVWLLTAGGATFAAFPEWYATMFSGFYLALGWSGQWRVTLRRDPGTNSLRIFGGIPQSLTNGFLLHPV